MPFRNLKSSDRSYISNEISRLSKQSAANAQYQATVAQHEALKNRLNDVYLAALNETDPEKLKMLEDLADQYVNQAQQLTEDWERNGRREVRRARFNIFGTIAFFVCLFMPFLIPLVGLIFGGWLFYAYVIKRSDC